MSYHEFGSLVAMVVRPKVLKSRFCFLLLILFSLIEISAQPFQALESRRIRSKFNSDKPTLIIPVGHSGFGIFSIAFSPNGKLLASGGDDKTIKLWEVASGEELRTFSGHTSRILSLAFSPDGKTIVSGSADKLLKFWDVISGQELRTITDYSDYITATAFSPDGKILAFGGGYKTILWDTQTSKELRTLTGHISRITSLAFSRNGKTVVVGGGDERVTLWDAATGRELSTLTSHTDSVFCVSSAPDGRIFASGSGDKTIKVWDAETGMLRRTLLGHHDSVTDVAFSPDGKTLVSGSADQTLKLWDVATGQELKTFIENNSPISSLAISPDGKILASGDYGRTVKLYDIATGQELKTLAGRASYVSSIATSTDGNILASGGILSNDLKLWNLANGQLAKTLIGHAASITEVAFSPGGDILASGSEDGSVKLWNVASGKELTTLSGHSSRISFLKFSPNGTFVASGSDDETIKLWDVAKGSELKTLSGHRSWINAIAFSVNGKILASAGGVDNLLKVWDVQTGIELGNIEEGNQSLNSINSLAFSPDGTIIASASGDFVGPKRNRIRLAKVSTGQTVRMFVGHASETNSLAFSTDGNTLASENTDGTVDFWDVATGQLIKYENWPERKGENLRNVIPIGSKKLAIAVHVGNKIVVRDVETQYEIATLIALDEHDWVVTAPDGRFDTNKSLDTIEGLHWFLPTEPFRAFPLEIFLRQYFEPSLLRRLLKCNEARNCETEFKPLPSIADINRVQPKVSITDIKPAASDPDSVAVIVEVESVIDAVSISATDPAKKKRFSSGAFDLRLFRDGQLVGYSTSGEKLQMTFRPYRNFEDELAVWREANKVDLLKGKKTFAFTVRLPANPPATPRSSATLANSGSSPVNEVEFSAYAFNEDRVKSNTATARWSLSEAAKSKPEPKRVKPRAYVISVGVNANENPAFDLQFAANDARRFQEELSSRLAATNEYSEVVPVSLISDWTVQNGRRVTTRREATKANFKAVMDLLAGRRVSDDIKRAIPNADKLLESTPDDLVMILFSSHGYADRNGAFYFIPYDTGAGSCKLFTETVRARSISSDELSLWLRDVDAGQMTLIVDACYSTAAIEGSGFKPGPMGSRGLGQLAYDKRMRILTATQADNVAMELTATADGRPIKHGLLSYALLENGLDAGGADFKPLDKNIFMAEWLEFGAADVPRLFALMSKSASGILPAEFQTGATVPSKNARLVMQRELADTGTCASANRGDQARPQEQQPALFDFTRRGLDVLIMRKN